jgi:hypothetical protein
VSLSLLDSHGLSHEPSAFPWRVFTLFPSLWQVAHCWGQYGVRDVLQKVVDLDSPAEWARLINERAKVFKKHMPIAFNNLAVAQH